MNFAFGPSELAIKITASCFIFLLAVFLFSPFAVKAQTAGEDIIAGLDATAGQTPLQKADPRVIVGRIIKIVLGFLGAVALIIVIYAGYLYMTSGGDAAKTETARKWLINALIGLIIIFSAYAITSYVFNKLFGATEPSGGGSGLQVAGGLPGTGYGLSTGAFGLVIQNHYPLPEQTSVPRNTMILATFKVPISPASVIDAASNADCPKDLDQTKNVCGKLKNDAFRIYKCSDMIKEEYGDENKVTCFNSKVVDIKDETKLVPGYAILTEDHQTIMFNPYGDTNDHLGSPIDDVPYIVYLTPKIKRDDKPEQTVFTTTYPDYRWRFTTSTVLDLTPPKVSSVVPIKQAYPVKKPEGCKCPGTGCADYDCQGLVYLNQSVYANFNEPIIPPFNQKQDCTLADNDNEVQLTGDKNLANCLDKSLPGTWKVGLNQYKTVQFISTTQCNGGAVNSCGEKVFCLPSNAALTGKILAAQVLGVGTAIIGTGIMDMGGNSLDGNGDGKSDGPGSLSADPNDQAGLKDNYFWNFKTGEDMDLISPYIVSLDPNNKTQNLKDLQAPLKATFSENLDAETVDQEVILKGTNPDGKDFTGWFDANYGEEAVLDANGGSLTQEKMSEIVINHGPFAEWLEGSAKFPVYTPAVNSDLKDTRQNCFSPSKEEKGKVLNSSCADDIKVPGASCCPEDGTYKLKGVLNAEECQVPE